MIIIGICDDEIIYREYIKELCERFFMPDTHLHKYIEFASGEEVLSYTGEQMQLLFLDVEMGTMDGLQVLDHLQSIDRVWRVVFVTSHEENVWNAFSLKTLGFSKKPVQYEQVAKWMEIAIREYKENQVFDYSTLGGKRCNKLEDIFYFEAAGNYSYLGLENEKHLVNEKLKKWHEVMGQTTFVRIHKSYLINMQHIKRWESDKVLLENGILLPIGRSYSQQAKELYYNYVRKQALRRGE